MKHSSRLAEKSVLVTMAVLVAGLAFVYPASSLSAIQASGAMMEENDKMTSGTMSEGSMMMDKPAMHHALKGQIANVQLGSDGTPEWIQLGYWLARASFDENNQPQSVQFVAKFTMIMPDGTAGHEHKIYGFETAEYRTEQGDTVHVLTGSATVTMRDGPVMDVPLSIKVLNNSVIELRIGPDGVDGHFGTGPIYGLLSAGSRGVMSEMQSMMSMGNGGGAMVQTLTETSLPVTLPLTPGYANGHDVYYISTEASDRDLAELMTNWTGARVVYSPSLANTPPAALANIYAFKNGVEGSGPLGFQPNVADSEPGSPGYSPLWRIILAEWNEGSQPSELKSEQEITDAVAAGQLTLEPTTMIVNCPFVKWEGGSLMIRENKTLADDSPYGPGQVLDIDTEGMTVTFVAHRGFAPDGSTIYYIATDASNQDVANALGVIFVNKTGATTFSGASSDLWVFTNGIKGTGPMGFQASIAGSNVGDVLYSPMWRITAATWQNASDAKFLTTAPEIASSASAGLLKTEVAGFVVNCPFVEVDA